MLLSPDFNSKRSTDGLNIAVILAGQVRTMDYCLPKLRDSFDGPPHDILFSVDMGQ